MYVFSLVLWFQCMKLREAILYQIGFFDPIKLTQTRKLNFKVNLTFCPHIFTLLLDIFWHKWFLGCFDIDLAILSEDNW